MNFKTLIITTLSFTSICSASMHEDRKPVNKSISIDVYDVDFRTDGMFLKKDCLYEIRLSKLVNEESDYIAFYIVDFICRSCGTKYNEHPGTCTVCESTDIIERERDLWPIGSLSLVETADQDGKS